MCRVFYSFEGENSSINGYLFPEEDFTSESDAIRMASNNGATLYKLTFDFEWKLIGSEVLYKAG